MGQYIECGKTEIGRHTISDNAIKVLSGLVASRVSGVACLNGGVLSSIAESVLKDNLPYKGIKVYQENNKVKIIVNVSVEYGCNMQKVAKDVARVITNEIEAVTGIKDVVVDVKIEKMVVNTNGNARVK